MDLSTVVAMSFTTDVTALIVLSVIVPFGFFWVTQFIQLMLMSDFDFPSRHDKLIWAVSFLVCFLFAPFAFWGWKSAFLEQHHQRLKDEENSTKKASSSA